MKVNDVNTYFSVLGLTPTATRDDVRKAYLTISKRCHPDKCTDPGAIDRKTKEFQKLREAYDELQNILGADDDDVFAEPGSEEMSNEDNEPGADDDIEEKFRVLKEKCEILQKRTAEIIELGVDIKVEAQEEMEVEVVEEMDEDTDPPPPADVAPPTDKKMEEQSVEEAGGPSNSPTTSVRNVRGSLRMGREVLPVTATIKTPNVKTMEDRGCLGRQAFGAKFLL